MITLPSWAPRLRDNQVDAIQRILTAYNSGSNIVFYEAPTGTGKTLVADQVRQSLNVKSLYVCSSRSLQRQFLRDFPSAALLEGRNNYPTLDYSDRFDLRGPGQTSCADCTKRKTGDVWNCRWCSSVTSCPYEVAKRTAIRADLACVNAHYFLTECNYIGALSGRGLIVIDEADTLEDTLMSFIEVSITPHRIKKWSLSSPSKKTVLSSWIEWVNDARSILSHIPTPDLTFASPTAIRDAKSLTGLKQDLARLANTDTGLPSGNWVYDGYNDGHIVFRPITVAPYTPTYLWRHAPRFLLMSATIISDDELATSLGA